MRTYAPAGQTPVIKEYLTHDHLSAMSGITPEGKLYMTVQESSYKGPDVVSFLRHLLRHIPGKLLVLWDRAPIHRSKVVKKFLAQGAAKRIHLEQLPAYAPELNPDEGIWNYLKRVELKNLSCHNYLNCSLSSEEPRSGSAIRPISFKPASSSQAWFRCLLKDQ